MDKIKEFIKENNTEIMVLLGILFILYATFLINFIVFLYLMGVIFIVLGVIIGIKPNKK